MIDDDHRDQMLYTEHGYQNTYATSQEMNFAFLGSRTTGEWVGDQMFGRLANETRAWVDHLATGSGCYLTTVEEARRVLAVTLAIEKSLATVKRSRSSPTEQGVTHVETNRRVGNRRHWEQRRSRPHRRRPRRHHDRPMAAHVEKMRADGLRITMPDNDLHLEVDAHHVCDLASLKRTFRYCAGVREVLRHPMDGPAHRALPRTRRCAGWHPELDERRPPRRHRGPRPHRGLRHRTVGHVHRSPGW